MLALESRLVRAVGCSEALEARNAPTRLELSFAIVLVAGATGLGLALGLAERKRNLAILGALGAKQRQLAAFVWSEALVVLIGGGLVGATLGFGAALALVKVLTGVFVPPPESLAIPANISHYWHRPPLRPPLPPSGDD